MDEHLTDDDLAALELGELPAPPRRHLVALHLKLGCPECLARSGDRLVPVLDPQWNGDTQPDLGGRRGLQYDFILKSAIRTALSKLPEIEAARKQAQSEVCGEARLVEGRWPRCTPELRKARVEAWLEEAQASRRDPVDEYLVLAGVAAAYAKKLEPKGEAADVRALAFAEAANAQRRLRRFPEAETWFARAWAVKRQGTLSQAVALEIASLHASLFIDQRQFDAAIYLLRRGILGFQALGESHRAGALASNLGRAYRTLGEPQKALEALNQAVSLIDPVRDPLDALAAAHNTLLAQLELGLFLEAERFFPRAVALHEAWGTAVDRVKLDGLRAKLLSGQGHYLKAARVYLDVIAAFERLELFAESAIVRLDLAELYLTHNRFDRAQIILEDVREVFEALGVHREAFAALLLLKEAVVAECATVAMVRKVAEALGKGKDGRAGG